VDEGSISERFQDTTGAVVRARLTLLNTDKLFTLQTTTEHGEYSSRPSRIGTLHCTVTAKAFPSHAEKPGRGDCAAPLVNVQVKLGAQTETIEVTTAPPLLQTEEASVGQVVNERR